MRLFELQLDNKYLTCRILPQIEKIKNLQISLNLSSNHIHGNLPHELGKLDKMVSLDLSRIIPSKFKSMLSLIEVNFSNNQLTCPVPIFTPFQKSHPSSLLGNKGLCGDSFQTTFGRQLFLEPKKRKLLEIVKGDLKNGLIACARAIEDVDLMMEELLMTNPASGSLPFRRPHCEDNIYRSLLYYSSWDKELIPRANYVVISIDGGLQICGNPKELNRLMNKLADRLIHGARLGTEGYVEGQGLCDVQSAGPHI
ncbi:hypothetical protein IEQ34_017449 [Dendrobium chrysotoxum]|uniref:Uncharacterized protein n=1 Tax=Dendrobium chrysotoxum TaxID=161865 RepID=A0AAV7GBK0_DENCH|nr:hypothetical protein IEQ34_017449 [Dendrobium chrysotoxum]